MSAADEFVVVEKAHLESLHVHCQHCPGFAAQWRALPELLYRNPRTLPAGESSRGKRKASNVEANRKRREKPSRSQSARDSFLSRVPRPATWRKKQIEAGLIDPETYKRVVRALTGLGSINVKDMSRAEAREGDALVGLTFRLAALAKSSITNSNLQRSFSNFQALIVLSMCAVLEKRGTPYSTVDQITQCITDAGEGDRKRFRRGAVWINGLIAQLVGRGWCLYRATELFFLSKRSRSLSPHLHLP